jgi:hypothetical protein
MLFVRAAKCGRGHVATARHHCCAAASSPSAHEQMRVFTFSLALLACVASARSQYFSAGWSPNDPTTDTSSPTQPEHTYTPVSKPSSGNPLQDFLTSGPLAQLFAKLGYNLTEHIEAAAKKEAEKWDSRIPLITDENYDDMIVNETLTLEEEKDRVWFLVV